MSFGFPVYQRGREKDSNQPGKPNPITWVPDSWEKTILKIILTIRDTFSKTDCKRLALFLRNITEFLVSRGLNKVTHADKRQCFY